MSREEYFSATINHRLHEDMYRYDSPFRKRKGTYSSNENYSGGQGRDGKSAYEIAVSLGFEGTEEEWINSLKGKDGITPHIGQNGNWFIGEQDTGISASGESSSEQINSISEEDINNYFNQKEEDISFQNNRNLLNSSDIDNLFN